MSSVLVVGDERKGGSVQAIEQFADWLRSRVEQVTVVMDREADLEHHRCDLVVVFGGDGSLLGAARRMGHNQMPTLGINLGRLGFLTAFGHEQAREAVEKALVGELHEERRLMLECSVERGGGEATRPTLCLNDVVLGRLAASSMVTLTAERDGGELSRYTGDGVIVATPVGSTAYSLAAGGPLLSPGLDALILTPLASHTLSARSLVVPVQNGLDLRVHDCGGADSCALVLDGQVQLDVGLDDRVLLRPASVAFRHLTRGPGSFFEILQDKFGWSVTPRQRVGDLEVRGDQQPDASS